MKNKLKKYQNRLVMSSATLCGLFAPTAHASDLSSTDIIFLICASLIDVFFAAGIVLLVWSVVQLILAIKNEDAESKVQASSQIALAITIISFEGIFETLKAAANITEG